MESGNSIKKQCGLEVAKKATEGHVQLKPVFGEYSESKNEDGSDRPQYIQTLMEQAECHKHDQERPMEQQVQKERETEGEAFKDKEAFIAASYRKKLEELDEEEKQQDELEALAGVSKQEDLSGFCPHLYHQTVTEDKPATEQKKESIEQNLDVEVERKDEADNIKHRIGLDSPINSNNDIEEGTSSPRKESEPASNETRKCKRKSLSASNSTNQDADSEITNVSQCHSDGGENEEGKLAIMKKQKKRVHSKRNKKKQRLSAEGSQSKNEWSKSVLENGTISSSSRCHKRASNSTNQNADSEKTSCSKSHSDEEEGEKGGPTKKRKQRENMLLRKYRKRQRLSGGSRSENERPNYLLEKEIGKSSNLGTSGIIGQRASRLNNSSITYQMESKNSIRYRAEDFINEDKENKNILNIQLKAEKKKKRRNRSVFEKRTVGVRFIQAQQRYFARKAAREKRNIVF